MCFFVYIRLKDRLFRTAYLDEEREIIWFFFTF